VLILINLVKNRKSYHGSHLLVEVRYYFVNPTS